PDMAKRIGWVVVLSLVVLALGCGGKKKKKVSDPAALAEAVDISAAYCACANKDCADAVKSPSGKTPYQLFLGKGSGENITNEQMPTWQAARDAWNTCATPGYFEKKAAPTEPTPTAPAAGADGG